MKRTCLFIASACLVCAFFYALAAGAEAGKNGFQTTFAAGLSLARGNSETMQANGSIVSQGEKKGLGMLRLGIEGNYGRSNVGGISETTVDNAKTFADIKKSLSEKVFAYLDISLLYDNIARIRYRAMAGPGVDFFIIKKDASKLSVQAGATYIWEKVAGIRADYAAYRAAQRLDHNFSKTSRIWQSIEYLPQAADFGNYLINAELGAEAALTAGVNLRFVLQDKYDSEPGAGLKSNDVLLIAGISFKL